MKIGILSDSHDNLGAIAKAVSLFNDMAVDHVVHAGDLVSPFAAHSLQSLKAPLVAVYGNNDGERLGLFHVLDGRIHRPPYLLELAGRKILILHEPDNIEALALSGHFDGIIYGHTHQAEIRERPIPIINPGECGGWLTGRRTVAVWDLESRQITLLPL